MVGLANKITLKSQVNENSDTVHFSRFEDFLRAAGEKEKWKGFIVSLSVVPRQPSMLRDCDERRDAPLNDRQDLMHI